MALNVAVAAASLACAGRRALHGKLDGVWRGEKNGEGSQ